MRKILSKKINLFGKEISVFVISLFAIVLVSAALISSWGTITGLVTVGQGLKLDGQNWDYNFAYDAQLTSLEAKTVSSGEHTLANSATVDATVTLDTLCTDTGSGGCLEPTLVTTTEYLLSSTGSIGSSNENRIHINAGDVAVTTLSDLTSISWDVDASGYMAHVDVLIDTTGDGSADDALVFEAAKVDASNCDITPYPTGSQDTFGNGQIVDSDAKAWLASGPAGGCSSPITTFFWHTLSDWKTGPASIEANDKTISGTTTVIGFQIETDNYIMNSESDVSGLKINGVAVTKITILAGDDIDFQIVTDFPKMMLPDTYTLTTTVNPVA